MNRSDLITSMAAALGGSYRFNMHRIYIADNVPQFTIRQIDEHLELVARCDAERIAKAEAKRARKAARKEAV